MTPNEVTQYGTTLGPVGLLVLFILREWMKGKSDAPRTDPVIAELGAIKDLMASLDKRLAVVETILEERKR